MNKSLNPSITPSKVDKEDDWVYSYHAVAFLDLMGQRKIFEGMMGVPKSKEEEARLIGILEKTVVFITTFRQGFKDLFASMQQLRETPVQIPKEFHAEYRNMQNTEIKFQSLSDAIVAWTPIYTVDEPALSKAMNSLWGILVAVAGMNLLALSLQHPVRGGIDVDGAIPLEKGGSEIYGPALNCAYELESRVAKSPRILIGNGLLKFLNSIESNQSTSRYIIHAKMLAKQCRGLITLDEDKQPILHFLGPSAMELMLKTRAGTGDYRKDILEPAYAFVKVSAKSFKNDAKLGPRYALLLRYFENYLLDGKGIKKSGWMVELINRLSRRVVVWIVNLFTIK